MHQNIPTYAIRALLCTVCGTIGSTDALANSAPSSGIHWIDWAADQAAFALQEAVPAEPAPAQPAVTHSIESVEINRLREEIRLLRDLMEQEVIGRVISLESEVRTLRAVLQQQQIAALGSGPVVPQPGVPGSLDAYPVYPATPMPEQNLIPGAALPEEDPAPELPAEPFQFTSVDEWGRSPETVAELGGGTSTLIGMAGLVPPRSAREDIIALGQQLRREYEAYDNINIEVFDTEAAAEAFADSQAVDAAHHVLSISRLKASGRDLIVYLGDGQAETIPYVAE